MAKNRSRTLTAFVVTATLTALGWQSSVAVAGSVALTPLADASINSANPAINYGATSPLHVDGSPVVATYLRFNVANVTATSAVLTIVPTSSQSTGFDVHALADDTWLENGLTWNNHPAWDPSVLGSSGPATAGSRLSINLPPGSVSNRANVDFVLTTSSQTALALASRESSTPPQLNVTQSAPSPTPSSTASASPSATPSPPPTPTPTPSPSPSTTPLDPIVMTAGDIGCGLTNTGGMSPGGACQQAATASLLGVAGVAAVLPLGDNEYECGELSNFQSFYGPTWGQFKNLTKPVVGNHEYLTAGGSTPCLNSETQTGAPGYFSYFGGAGSPLDSGCTAACRGYYSFDLGAWHLIALNAECGSPGVGGCGAGSAQETWLKADLAAHPNRCVLAYWHQPRFTSGQEGDTSAVQTFWSDLYDAGADLVLNGHDHDYERFGRLGKITTIDSSGAEQPALDPNGMREIIVGTGGRNLTKFPAGFKTGSQVHDSSTFGVLKLSLHPTSYDWSFVPAGSGTFTDSGTTSCRFSGGSGDTSPPTTPTGLAAVATSSEVDLSWMAATDNVAVAGYQILRDGAQLALIPASAPTYRDTAGLVAGRTYAYAVQAVDAAGNRSAPTSPVNATIPASSGSVTGTVTDASSGLPIVGALVSDSVGTVTTDSAGHYNQTLPASTYVVTATAGGYGSANANVTITAGGTATQNFALSPVIFSDGFESGSFSAWNGGSAVNMAVETSTVEGGRDAAEANVSGVAYGATKTLPTTYSAIDVRTFFRLHSKSTNVGIDRIRTAAGIDILHLYVDNATGQLGLRNDVSGVSTLSGHVLAIDAWHSIETKVAINGTASTIQVWLDGVDQTALDSATANLGTTNVGQVMIGDTNARTADAFWDDVAVSDARGS